MNKRAPAILMCTLLFVLGACGGAPAPTQTPFSIVVSAGPGPVGSAGPPSPTPAPTLAGATPVNTEVKLSTYNGSTTAFSLQYPSDWTAVDHEQSQKRVLISAPDRLSSLLLIYGSAGTLTTEEVLQSFLSNFSVPALKTSNQRKNADGSMGVDLRYNDSTGSPLLGLMRFVRQSTSANFYGIIFSATPEKFSQTRALGVSLLDSFQERTSSVSQATPSVIAGAASTSTSSPTPVTSTPVPVETPLPSITRRPAAGAAFRIDALARGYENWGTPKEGCQSVSSGQWDNTHPMKRISIDVSLTNNSNQTIRAEDLSVAMFNNVGAPLLGCIGPPVPSALPHSTVTYVLTTFLELTQFLSEMRMQVGGSTVRTCFARNNRADVVNCG